MHLDGRRPWAGDELGVVDVGEGPGHERRVLTGTREADTSDG